MPQSAYQDYYWGTPRRISQRPREYPFRATGDVASYTYDVLYAVHIDYFTPTAAGTVDPENAAAYLLEETKPEIQQGKLATFRRTYGTIPVNQVSYTSRAITLPSAAAQAGVTGSTSQILYEGASAYLWVNYLNLIWGTNNKAYNAVATVVVNTFGADSRVYNWTAHGLAGTETILVGGANGFGTRYGVYAPGAYTIVDADTVDLLGVNLGSHITSAAKYFRAYTPGVTRARVRGTQSFYLAGVTSGISSGADIPVPSIALNDATFLALIAAAASGYVDYDAEPLQFWRGRIYTLTQYEIDLGSL